jgi:hypothetical protein
VRHLAHCVQAQRFGRLLRVLQLDDAVLADLYYDVETRRGREDGDGDAAPRMAIGQPVAIETMLGDVFGDESPELLDGQAAPADDVVLDHADRYADAVVQHWIGEVRAIADSTRLCNYFRMPDEAMSVLTSEMISGARRLDLRGEIAARVRTITSFRQKLDQAMGRPAFVAAYIINAFVDWLGFESVDPTQRPAVGRGPQRRTVFAPRPLVFGAPELPAEPAPYDQMQYVDWMAAFMRLVEDNASTLEGRQIDVQQNARLGALISGLDRAA